MNHLNASAAAREQVTMMQRGLEMLSGKYSVLNRLMLVAVMAMVFGLLGVAQKAAAYSAGDPIYINTTASSYCAASGNNFTVTVTLTDFAGNGVTGQSNLLDLKKIEDVNKSGPNTSFNTGTGQFTDNGDGTYSVSGNINDNGNDPYYIEVEWTDGNNYKMKSAVTLNIDTTCSSNVPARLDSAPDYTYYPTSGTVVAKFRLLAQDGSPYTGATLETGNNGNGGQDTLYVNKVESINKVKFSDNGGNWTVSSATDNGDGTYTFVIDYSGGVNDIWVVEARYEYDNNGNVKLSGSFAFEINTSQASGGNPTGTPPTNPGAPELTTPPCAATTPSDLAAVAISSTQVDLTWTYDGTNDNYYTVYRDAVQIATNVTSGSYSDSTAFVGTSYAYTVRGHNTAGTCDSVDSNTANVTTPSCTESTPSSISFNGVNTALSDFSGSSMVNVTDLTNLEFRVTEGSGSGTPFPTQTDDFAGLSDGTQPNFGNWTGANGSDGTNGWVVLSGSTGSGTTGPAAGNPDPYVYLESSASSQTYGVDVTAGSSQYIESNVLDASQYAFSFTFDWDMNVDDNTDAELHVDAWNGSSWALDVNGGTVNTDNNGDTWVTEGPIDLSSYTNNDFKLRIRYIVGSGTIYRNDIAVDNLVVSGTARATEVERLAWNPDPQEASAVLTDGNSYNLYARGTDPECGTVYTATGNQAFSWSSCTETKTLTLAPITDPITGNVTVTATGTATGIQVGTSPAPTNASGWVYAPAQDDSSTTVSFYATGTGTCGTLTASQLNVGTNTMAAPTVTAFSVPATVVDTAAPLDVPISSFTASDNLAVTGYMITESSTAPTAGAAGWTATAPTTYTVASYGSYTLYGWAKDAAGNVSLSSSSAVTMSNCTPTVTALNISVVTNPINYPTAGSVINVVPTGGTVTNAQWSANGGGSWSASGASYTAPVQASGSVNILGRATEDTCSTLMTATNEPVAVTYDTRSNGTEAGTATAIQTAIDTISVTMPYLGDKNADATFQVDYKLASSGTWATGTPTLDSGGSPYTQNIAGLVSTETYDVRVTYADVDTILSGTAIQNLVVVMQPWADNPMLHNSLRFTGTTKHGGNWGTPGNYAGGITCSTCHAKNTGNVKRIQTNISFPDGSTMPGGGTSAAVSLLTVEDGTSDFGDDSTAPRTSSNKVCEACHTADLTQTNGVKQHAANQAAASGHYDNADCIKCHQHNAGFKADCTTCHGNPPVANTLGGPNGLSDTPTTGSATSGKHTLHAVTKAYACNTCHTGWEAGGQMPNSGNINVGFSAFGDTTATYDGRATGAYTAAAGTTVGTGGALTCSAIYCHGTSTPKWLDTEAAMACGSCHGNATDGGPIETAGDGDLSGAITGKKVGKHVKHIPISQTETGTACGLCHNGAGDGTALHVNGSNDIIFDTTKAGASATYTPGTSTCSNLSCHGTQVWDTASAALACDSCHGYPPTATSPDSTGATNVDHTKFSANGVVNNHSECNTCHGKSQTNGLTDNTANGGDVYLDSYHRDGNIEMNGWATDSGQDAQYQQGTFGCAKACHANDASHQLSDSGLPVQLHRYGGGSCTGCHDGTGAAGTAKSISVDSPHSTTITGYTCEQCHTAHESGTVIIPNNTTVGINYGLNGETGISLGGSATTGTTEAQICWNCHDSKGVSEWGTNTNATTGSSTYNYGTLSTSNWTTATWTSGTSYFAYKTGAIESTHSVNGAVAQAGKDTAAQIRCSYCHDVHDLNTLASDNTSGKPYLRGTWKGNPYKEDGAPESSANGGAAYTNLTQFGSVPRGSTSQSVANGGYWIDQNSGNPTSGWTLSTSAGLCTLCHGTNVDTMNKFGTAANAWVGTNGHSNAVIGGSGSAKTNIFDLRGGTAGNSTNPAMAFQGGNKPGDNGSFGFRGQAGSAAGFGPALNPSTEGTNYGGYQWGATVDNATTDTQFHTFSCSKCHNPHASRLPRLMITNCLDTKHNSWDDSYGTSTVANFGNLNSGRHISNWTTAQNCHRVGDPTEGANGAGWNKVTPWTNTGTPDNGTIQ